MGHHLTGSGLLRVGIVQVVALEKKRNGGKAWDGDQQDLVSHAAPEILCERVNISLSPAGISPACVCVCRGSNVVVNYAGSQDAAEAVAKMICDMDGPSRAIAVKVRPRWPRLTCWL